MEYQEATCTTANNRFTGLVGVMVFTRYIGEHGKSVKFLPAIDNKYAFREVCTPP